MQDAARRAQKQLRGDHIVEFSVDQMKVLELHIRHPLTSPRL